MAFGRFYTGKTPSPRMVKICNTPPYELYIYWFAYVLGATGKTSCMQSIIDRIDVGGLFCKATQREARNTQQKLIIINSMVKINILICNVGNNSQL